MEGGLRKGGVGEAWPQLLDLIPNKRDWLVGNGGGSGFGVAEEKTLELRLGLPGGEDWSAVEGKKEESSVLSLGIIPKAPKCTTNSSSGAKRGFSDTLETNMEAFQQQQKPGFLHFPSTAVVARESLQKANGVKAEQQQGLERKACSPAPAATPSSGNAAVTHNTSQTRTATAPVVGWPPIRSFRKNLASSTSKPSPLSQSGGIQTDGKQENVTKGMFVKINMEGIPIGRKVDLKAYDSYEKLSSAVDELFRGLLAAQRETPATGGIQNNTEERQTITGLLDGSGEYTLVYEDNEGDKLLAGDVPWDMFVSSVKRLRVLKSSELSALSLAATNRRKTVPETRVQ